MTDHPPSNDIATWRILIVDDEPDNLKLASEFLAFSGATVATAENGAQSLALVDEFEPSVILLDLSMPGVDGWEVQHQLRQRPDLAHVPIIALTALAMPEDRARADTAGFDGYITKPFRVGSLVRDLTACVQAFSDKYAAQPVSQQEPHTAPSAEAAEADKAAEPQPQAQETQAQEQESPAQQKQPQQQPTGGEHE